MACFLKNTIKTPEVIFHIRLPALRLSSSLILRKYLYASFTHNSKEPSSREKISECPVITEKIMSALQPLAGAGGALSPLHAPVSSWVSPLLPAIPSSGNEVCYSIYFIDSCFSVFFTTFVRRKIIFLLEHADA